MTNLNFYLRISEILNSIFKTFKTFLRALIKFNSDQYLIQVSIVTL